MPPDLQLAVYLHSHFCLAPSAFSSSLPSKGKRETFSHGIHHVLLSTNRKPHGQNSGSLEKFLASLSIYRALLPYKRECRHPLVAISSRFPFDFHLSRRPFSFNFRILSSYICLLISVLLHQPSRPLFPLASLSISIFLQDTRLLPSRRVFRRQKPREYLYVCVFVRVCL